MTPARSTSRARLGVVAALLLLVGCSTGSSDDLASSRAPAPSDGATPGTSTPTTTVTGAPTPSVTKVATTAGSGRGVVLTYAEVFSGGQSTPAPDTLVATLVGSYGAFARDGVLESLANADGFYICDPPGTRTCNLFPAGPGSQDPTAQTLQYRRPLEFLTKQVVKATTKQSTRTVAGRRARCLSGRDQITGETDVACADVATGYLLHLNMPDLLGSLTLVSIRTGQEVGPLALPPGFTVASS